MPNDSDLVRFLAEKVMGWKIIALALTSGVFDSAPGHIGGVRAWPRNWSPLESIVDAFEVQGAVEISRYGDFVAALRLEVGINYPISSFGRSDLMLLICATARQRSTAIARAYGWEG